MTELELALTLNAIALGMDDKTFSNIKYFLDKIENGFRELSDENSRLKGILDKLQKEQNS